MGQTLVTFHAHPDDAEIVCGGTVALAKAAGYRVVLVVATRGELGEVRTGVLTSDETLAERREAETRAAADLLGIDRVEFLGYVDSGMAGEPTNDAPDSFAGADADAAAKRLAHLLHEERADVLTIYDGNGGYGHPDHVQVHRVGVLAAELAGTPAVFEATMNRDHFKRLMKAQPEAMDQIAAEERPAVEDLESLGVPEDQITTTVDVREYVMLKRDALALHESQVGPESFFFGLSDDAFREAFGYEWFIRRGA
ncbi:MAG: PIG-L family deacetylase, partial [Acidimicrobiia bacterium]